jgi:2-oxo-3-hexenedioate decarboxylase
MRPRNRTGSCGGFDRRPGDGPLSALRQLFGLLARDPVNPPLATGDIATTGTLTRAFPILPGESWSTTLHGIELGGRPVWFA